jgi:hypothetical protein
LAAVNLNHKKYKKNKKKINNKNKNQNKIAKMKKKQKVLLPLNKKEMLNLQKLPQPSQRMLNQLK